MSKTVQRYDVGGLGKPVITPAGFLRAEGHPTKAGIFVYRNPDGTQRRELRSEVEVFKADSLATLQLAPVTDDHPPANLTAENAAEYQRGAVGESVHQDGDLVRAPLMVTDRTLVGKMMKGKQALSCGYTCDVEEEAGTWRGQRYDAVQKNIRYNHLAVVDRGRAGADARVRMDAADAGMVSDPSGDPAPTPTESKVTTLKTFRHDGVSYEAPEQVVELFQRIERERADAVKGLDVVKADAQKRVDSAEAKADGLKSELEKVKADAAKLPTQLRSEIKARMALESKARTLLPKGTKLDSLTAREVQVMVLQKLQPKLDVAAKSDDYVAARFDHAMESAKDTSEREISRAREDVEEEREEERADEEERHDFEAAAQRNRKAMSELWKEPIGRDRSSKQH